MKVGINLIGVSKDPDNGSRRLINWILTYYRLKQRVIDCWIEQGHEVFIYITTYNTNQNQYIIDSFQKITPNPIKYQIIDDYNTHRLYTQKMAHELLRNENLDIVVDTRFEIIFHKNITEYDIKYDKFNVLFKEDIIIKEGDPDEELTCDAIFIYPYSMLEDLILLCEKYYNIFKDPKYDGYNGDMHKFYKEIKDTKGEEFVNLMTNDRCLSFNDYHQTHYTLVRVPLNGLY